MAYQVIHGTNAERTGGTYEAGTVFHEIDTGNEYEYTGSVWQQTKSVGAVHVSGLPGSVKRVSAAAYSTTDVLWVTIITAGSGNLTLSPKSGDTDIVITAAEIAALTDTQTVFYGPFDSVTAGTGMELLAYLP